MINLIKSFADLLYPPLCLHCNEPLNKNNTHYCDHCLTLMVPIEIQERCPFCFTADFNHENDRCCSVCKEQPPTTERMGAVFDYEGPAATLIKFLKYGGQPYLAKGAGAYLTARFLELEWPMPDYIVPMPMAPLRRFERGYNQSALLAEVVADMLGRPVYDLLKRRGGDFSQAGLNHRQRLQLKREAFSVKEGVRIHDKTLLIIDDVMTTGSSMRCCAEILQELYPGPIYALTVCRAM